MNEEKINMLRDYFTNSPKGMPDRLFAKFSENADTFLCFQKDKQYLLALQLSKSESEQIDYLVLNKTRVDEIRWFKSVDTLINYVFNISKASPLDIRFIR